MDAIPICSEGAEIDPTGQYSCPVCKVQGTGDEADTGWVSCPLLGNAMVCLGCCIDLQGVARSHAFWSHDYRGLFDQLASEGTGTLEALRETCLEHQAEVVDARLREGTDDMVDLQRLRELVSGLLGSLSNR